LIFIDFQFYDNINLINLIKIQISDFKCKRKKEINKERLGRDKDKIAKELKIIREIKKLRKRENEEKRKREIRILQRFGKTINNSRFRSMERILSYHDNDGCSIHPAGVFCVVN
jgi:hypothetical protein